MAITFPTDLIHTMAPTDLDHIILAHITGFIHAIDIITIDTLRTHTQDTSTHSGKAAPDAESIFWINFQTL